jgi:hypothetical protein
MLDFKIFYLYLRREIIVNFKLYLVIQVSAAQKLLCIPIKWTGATGSHIKNNKLRDYRKHGATKYLHMCINFLYNLHLGVLSRQPLADSGSRHTRTWYFFIVLSASGFKYQLPVSRLARVIDSLSPMNLISLPCPSTFWYIVSGSSNFMLTMSPLLSSFASPSRRKKPHNYIVTHIFYWFINGGLSDLMTFLIDSPFFFCFSMAHAVET